MTAGIPLPRGVCRDPVNISVRTGTGAAKPLQTRVLDRWPDGSLRWVLLDVQVDHPGSYTLEVDEQWSGAENRGELRITRDGTAIRVVTGRTAFLINPGRNVLVEAGPGDTLDLDHLRRVLVQLTDAAGHLVPIIFGSVEVECDGPLRATVRLDGSVEVQPGVPLTLIARLHFFDRSPAIRVELTVRNERPAVHSGGFWELGDPGSVYFRDLSVHVESALASPIVHCHLGDDGPLELEHPVELYQDSSGGENWRSSNHVNREGRIPVRFRGYQLRSRESERRGNRASPVMWLSNAHDDMMAVTMRHFWQNFPKALEADDLGLTLRLFPRQFDDLHELQGGEQKTHVVGMAFGSDPVGAQPLEWIQRPALIVATPEWYAKCEAVTYITPARDDPNAEYLALVTAAIEGPARFELKRETIDEYGWRNFGDLYADHEQAYYRGSAPIISHYNNQYDAIWGLGCQFLRTCDGRWWNVMNDLAAHVRDIDIYYTNGDKAAYNGGLFWHTAHYVDADRSTHRSYPRAAEVGGGGLSNEQAYAAGLMLHYFLTGDEASRKSAMTLADWVLEIDNGRRTVFRWLARGDTGLASATYSTTYHGPGRGAGHAISVLLTGFRLTGDRRYLHKAEALIRRCIHPSDDLAARQLLDAERRWSYTVFLQVLGRYLDDKVLRGELDERYAYARAALVHYCRWMAVHEYPYLDKPDILEYPTETWAAQDMRKSDIFKFAARHVEDDDERALFLERSDFFFRRSVDSLTAMPTRSFTRPVVIMLSCGFMHAAFHSSKGVPPAPTALQGDFGSPESFVPQRAVALRRAKVIAATGALCGTLLLWRLLAQ